jgi:ParB family chromosome partitioning protein
MTEVEKSDLPFKIIEIPIADIIFPESEMRTGITMEGLDELARSIAQCGLMNPITVRAKEGKYELIAGFRRTKAHEMLGRLSVPARVFNSDIEMADIQKAHENLFREEVSPLDEGLYIKTIMSKHNWSLEQLAVSLHKTPGYVKRRLALLDFPEDVKEALKDGVIVVGMAEELAKISNEAVRLRLMGLVINNGASIDVVRRWRIDSEINNVPQQAAPMIGVEGGALIQPSEQVGAIDLKKYYGPNVALEETCTKYHICHICVKKVDENEAKLLILCPDCNAVIQEQLTKGGEQKPCTES